MITPEVNIVIANRSGRSIHATITQSTKSKQPIVLLIHGFKGFRNWGFLPFAAQHLSHEGFIAIRTDMSLNGMRGTNNIVVAPEEFSANTITTELNDVEDIVNAILNHDDFDDVRKHWNNTLHLIGHSRGGAIVHIVAGEMRHRNDVKISRCVVWNSVGKMMRWSERQIGIWRETGFMEVENSRTRQKLRINVSFLDDILQNDKRFSLQERARELDDLLLYIHAEMDLTVPLKEIQELLHTSGSKAKLEVLEGSSHTFGITHPIELITPSFVKAMNLTTSYLKQ